MPFANFGPSIDLVQIDEAVLDTLKLWLPTYLSQQEYDRGKARGWAKRPRPTSYINVLEESDTLPDRSMPVIVAQTANTVGDTERDGNGMYSAAYRVVVWAYVRSKINGRGADTDARLVAAVYGAAIKRLIVQKSALGDLGAAVRWTGEAIEPLRDAPGGSRSMAVAFQQFTVFVEGLVCDLAGPVEPEPQEDPDDPYDEWPEVASVDTEIDAVPINQGE